MDRENLAGTTISVITYATTETMGYVNLMIESLVKFANMPDRFTFTILHPYQDKTIPLAEIVSGCPVIDVPLGMENIHNMRGSYAHGYALNYINTLNKSSPMLIAPIALIIDADIAILYKGWDDIVREELSEQCCFGFSRPNTNFPSIFFFAFKKRILDVKYIDFLPNIKPLPHSEEKTIKYNINTQKEATYRKQKIGDEVKCDTGYQLPMLFRGCGIGLRCVPSTDQVYYQLPHSEASFEFCKENPWHMCEWHYNGKLFGTHKQACRNHAYNGEYGRMWRKRIEWYICKNYPNIKLQTL